ncbi:hypothetical protein Micbo1qcDRAFT_231566 [Microdochium bolleyi]|uniref:Protein YAE1 n=1 Tax=Microdochium bolleyi TaxID=196109 RepID=A0A136JA49_9PEZI|nr:hypothetical protein Micbo1qcDRAFT_231566 [Microdochium bolleyi]
MHLSPRPPQDDEFYMQVTTTDQSGAGEGILDAGRSAPGHYYDPMDDIFGSEPGSPRLAAHNNGATTTTSADDENGSAGLTADLRRLRAQHNKEGYREGIMVGKAGSIQAGFDEGYSIGANVGLKAGQLLGLLEGIAAAVSASSPPARTPTPGRAEEQTQNEDGDVAAKAFEMYASAKAELGSTEQIFSEAYWQADGRWKYDVPGPNADVEEVENPTPSPEDVANAHPLIAKWSLIVDKVVSRWGLDLELPSLKSKDASLQDDTTGAKPIKLEQQSRQAMDW